MSGSLQSRPEEQSDQRAAIEKLRDSTKQGSSLYDRIKRIVLERKDYFPIGSEITRLLPVVA
jgi:hypothetical protein